ncbi:hypothetical protein EYC84_001655 [Monilinia fructicola]|uniref:Complex III subunit 7 n=1 Tax=Monilinia fructicola TaxID=38448 RepID=A0A5M9JSJ1_MONFR|nr:hypothetical protein EYC84_001655 [Monilinia fructicola]
MGFYRADDLIPEESEEVLLALKRLPQKEAYDRVFPFEKSGSVLCPTSTFAKKTNTPSLKKITHTFHPSLQKSKLKLRNVPIWSP